METYECAQTANDNLDLPEEVNTIPQTIVHSPTGMDTSDGEVGGHWTHCVSKNVHGMPHMDMPELMRRNPLEHGARLQEEIKLIRLSSTEIM